MCTTIVESRPAITQAWRRWQQHAYGHREVAFAILGLRIYLHVSRLAFGADLVQRHLLPPRVDQVFGIGRMSKFIVGFILVSAPIHLATFFRASAARLAALPWWYSFVEGV